MLSDEMLQLLTAFVDGELSDAQRTAVMSLLNKSSEAREVLRQLQENAHKIKQLPRHKVEPSLVEQVLEAIAERKTQPAPAPQPRRRRRWMPYIAATLAASLLIGAIGVAFWKATRDTREDLNPDYVQNPDPNEKPKSGPEPIPTPPPTPKKVNPLLADLKKMTEGIVRDFGAPIVDDKPFSASFADLKKDGKSTGDLVRELNREKAVYLDVTVKKNSEAMTRLQEILKTQGITVVADPLAKKTSDDKKAEYLVYADNLTARELTKLVNDLSDSYVVGLNNKQKMVPSPFQKVTLTPLATEEKQKVAQLLGVDPATLERKDAKPDAKSERTVLLLPGAAGAQPSAEVRRFLSERRGVQPGAVPVLIKIRQE